MATANLKVPPRRRFGLALPDSLSALGERDFRIVWIGQAVSMTGTWMQAIAQGLLVLQLWDSAFGLGVVNFANALPSLVVMLFGGVLADRADKRRILIITQAIMMMLALTLGVLIVTDRIEFWMIIVATAALGIAFGYDMPAYQAFLPDLVPPEKISQVVALNSSTFHGTRMVGPAMAGVIISVFGLATAYFLNAASFVAVLVSLLIIRYRATPRPADMVQSSAIEGLKEGIRYARSRPHIVTLLCLTALNTALLFPFLAILTPFYVKEVLDSGPGILGLLWAGSGLGSVLGAMALIWWSDHARASRMWAAALGAPVMMLALALTREPFVALLLMPFVSFAFSSQLGLIQTMLQESTPPQFRGRVMSLSGIMFNGTMPLAGLAAAGLAAVTGLPFVMILMGSLYAVLATLMLRLAGGGIGAVVAQSRAEFEAVAAVAPPPRH
jgi:MFS family permease